MIKQNIKKWRWDWEASCGLDIKVMDKRHKRLAKYINELNKPLKTKDRDRTASALCCIAEYTISHFEFEEQPISEADCNPTDACKKLMNSL
ncbi:MAG: hypothetical protein LBB59_07750 [Campylobacteraceae bacterium]|nr:hypothetical protein [Campylobacteraceae bacterium]